MQNPYRSWWCLSILLFICVFDTLAQINPAYQDMMKNQEMGSSRRRRNAGVQDSMTLANSTFMGIRDSTFERLKTVGVDYLSIYKKDLRDLNEKDKTVLSDCVVIGTVMAIERTPHDRHFATVAHVKVDEFLRNDYNLPLGQIQVMIVSGPIGSGYQRMESEDTLSLGEHVLLFLSAKMLLKSMLIDTAYFNRLINDPMVRFRIVGFDGKYHIQGPMAYCQWGGGNLLKMKEGIKAVSAILRPSPSADK